MPPEDAEPGPPSSRPKARVRVTWPDPIGLPRVALLTPDMGIGGVMAWFEALVAATAGSVQWCGVVVGGGVIDPRHERWVGALVGSPGTELEFAL